MCGIVGFVLDKQRDEGERLLKSCVAMLSHRGPDFNGYYIKDKVYLGHSRLSIVDMRANANQPFVDQSEHYSITFNGEIYNFQSLRKELQLEGVNFKTNSDTEVLLYAYIIWGVACLTKIEGMFAFAIYDSIKNEFFLARDLFGQKPLYYSTAKGFVFSSEFSSFQVLDKDLKYSIAGINHFLGIGYTLHPTTIYEDVWMLPPATYLVYKVSTKSVQIESYYNLAEKFAVKHTSSSSDLAKETYRLLEKAVLKRTMGDTPFGLNLSAGLDSNAVYAVLKKNGFDFPSFTIGFNNKLYDESQYLNYVKNLNIEVLDAINESEIKDYLAKIDYPTFDNSAYPYYRLSHYAKKQVKFVLGGDGADELFGGYSTYQADRLNRNCQMLIPIIKLFKYVNLGKMERVGLGTKFKRFVHGVDKDYRQAHYNWRNLFTKAERLQLLGKEHEDLINETDPVKVFFKHYEDVRNLDKTDQHLYVDFKTWLTDNVLIKVDRNAMLAGLEVRSPFLDKDLVEFIAACPAEHKYNKLLLKKAVGELIPDSILQRKKLGFNAPINFCLHKKDDEFRMYTKFVYQEKYLNL